MNVRELMTDHPVTLDPEDRLIDAEEQMGLRGFRHVPVVERGTGRLLGILSNLDVIRAALGEAGADRKAQLMAKAKIRVADVMAKKVDVIGPDVSIVEAAAKMRSLRRSCLPVCDGGVLIGILTEADFVEMVAKRG